MKKLSLKQRMMLLIGSLIFAQSALVFVAIFESNKLLNTLGQVTGTVLPATRDLTIADMHHDGLSARVYQALYYLESKDLSNIPELVKETATQAEDFTKIMDELTKIKLEKEIADMIQEVSPHVKKYAELSNEVVAYAQAGNREKLKTAKVDFFSEFKYLEENLEKIGTQFEKHSAQQNEDGKDIKTIVILFSALGLLMSLIVSGFVFTYTQQAFNEVLKDSEHVGGTLTELIDTVQNESNKVREASIEQAAAIQESVSALSEMSSMITQTSNNVKLSLDTSQNAIRKTVEGKEIMNRMEQSMSSIQKSNLQLQDLSKVIEDISSKTAIINDIVFKTQLLSFNASIEAARAGQHGRGFSVVAEEVGNLAEMSGQAAKDIELLLEDSQRKVKETLEVIQSRVNDSNRVSQMAFQAFQEVAVNIEEINGQVRSINEATQQQEIGIQQTNVAMKQVDVTSQGNTESASTALRQANELKQKSELLERANSRLSFLIRGKEIKYHSPEHYNQPNNNIESLVSKLVTKNENQFQSFDLEKITADDPDFKKMVS